jgi:hypothetical protein
MIVLIALCLLIGLFVGLHFGYRSGLQDGAADASKVWIEKGHSDMCAKFVVTESQASGGTDGG